MILQNRAIKQLIVTGVTTEVCVHITIREAEAMRQLAETSHRAYRAFVYETPGFLDYWHQATPIHELSQLPISSRPARRASAGGFEPMRAIPSWPFFNAVLENLQLDVAKADMGIAALYAALVGEAHRDRHEMITAQLWATQMPSSHDSRLPSPLLAVQTRGKLVRVQRVVLLERLVYPGACR